MSLRILEAVLTKVETSGNASDLLQTGTSVSSQSYRDAMALLSGAVNIVTSNGEAGQVGFAATAVCSVSDNPPTLLVCINRSSSSHAAILKNAVLCVNTLSSSSEEIAKVFGGQAGPIANRFEHGQWTNGKSGSPVLEGALASFDCRLISAHENGTHDIFVCEVIDTKAQPDADGLVYFKRGYHRI